MASPSSASVLDAELLSTSSFQKPRYPGRPTRAPSVESLHLSTLSNSSSGVAIHPNVLRKRHSNYALSNSSLGSSPVGIDRTMSLPPLPDVPTMDPIRSPRNPSRPVSQMPPPPQRKKPRSRPSTADNNKERSEVTPWEFQSLKEEGEGENPPLHSKAESPSVRSRSSFTALGKPTGPVAVVTPWEVQSLEEEVVEIEKVYEPKTPSQATTIGTPVTTLTGPVEEVTPWELHPMPATQSQRYVDLGTLALYIFIFLSVERRPHFSTPLVEWGVLLCRLCIFTPIAVHRTYLIILPPAKHIKPLHSQIPQRLLRMSLEILPSLPTAADPTQTRHHLLDHLPDQIIFNMQTSLPSHQERLPTQGPLTQALSDTPERVQWRM